jgi:hypothetical protein
VLQARNPSGAYELRANDAGHRGSESHPRRAPAVAPVLAVRTPLDASAPAAMRAAWVHIRTGINGYRSAASRLSRASRMVSIMAHYPQAIPTVRRCGRRHPPTLNLSMTGWESTRCALAH